MRLRPLTNSVPKCLVEINGRPLLDYWIELLGKGGIAELLINLHYLPDAVKSYVRSCRHPVNITTVYEERLLGTGGTLLKNRKFFRNEPCMLVHADNLSSFDVRDFSTEVLPHFMGRINTFHNAIYHRDIGTLPSFQAAQHEYPAAVAKRDPGDVGRVSA